ncbi:MAG TPA: hypothetical protein DCE23_04230 [Firmicutes bacterium]|nr:hypothetical protein [Bacillota bacterium]
MKIVEIKCPNCKASLNVNKDLEKVNCNYCGAQFLVEDETKTNAEKIIKSLGNELQKNRDYYSSEEYKKRLEIHRTESVKSLKILAIFLLVIFLIFGLIILLTSK